MTVESVPTPAAALVEDRNEDLIWGYQFFGSGAAESLQVQAVDSALERQDSWSWLHFDLHHDTSSSIASLTRLPPAALTMLLSHDDRQCMEIFGPVLCGVVADYERIEILDVRRIVRWRFAMTPNLFVSARRLPGHTLHQVGLDLQAGRRYRNVPALFSSIIHEFTSATIILLRDVSDRLDELEVQLLEGKDNVGGMEVLGLARRQLVRLRRQTVPQRAMLLHMLTEPPDWFDEDAITDCRRVAERMESLVDDLESLQERAHALNDEVTGREAEKMNRRLTLLSMVSAIFLPATFVTGIFGMNVGGLPWQGSPMGFLDAGALMVGSAVMMVVVLKRIRLL